jgi:hypothetical protein
MYLIFYSILLVFLHLLNIEFKDNSLFTDLNLPYPKMIDIAVPSNMVCGLQDLSVKPVDASSN